MTYISYAQAKLLKKNLIFDYFDDEDGQWSNYGTLDLNQGASLATQNHIDLRSFYPEVTKPSVVVDLSFFKMGELAGEQPYGSALAKTFGKLDDPITVKASESWVAGDSAYNSDISIDATSTWRRLKIQCTNSARSAYSKLNKININNYIDKGFITFAFPNVPASLDLENCKISLTTDTSPNEFDSSKTDTIAFNANSSAYYIVSNNGAELKIPITTTTLPNVFNSNNSNKGLITGIKLEIKLTTGTGDFYCSAIRCVSNNWKYAPVDINTLENKAVKTVPPNGMFPSTTLNTNINETATTIPLVNASNFPSSGVILINNKEYIEYTSKSGNDLILGTDGERGYLNSVASGHNSGATITLHDFNFPVNNPIGLLPTKWPIVYRTFNSNGIKQNDSLDLLHASVYAVISTGDVLGETATLLDPNKFSFYFRSGVKDAAQNDLNSKTQAQLNDLKIDDFITDEVQVTQADLSVIPGAFVQLQNNSNGAEPKAGLTQEALNTQTQAQLEYTTKEQISYAAVHFDWFKDPSDSTKLKFVVSFEDELAVLFQSERTFILNDWKNKKFVLKSELIDGTLESKIFTLDNNNNLILVFSTNRLESNFIHRKKGWFGWHAELKDGQTKIDSIIPNYVVYSEYKSSILNSITPVKGAQIFANQTKDVELITDINSNKWTEKSTEALSVSVNNVDKKEIKTYEVSDASVNLNQSGLPPIFRGIETNRFIIENFENVYVKFDIRYNGNNKIGAYFYNSDTNTFIKLNVPSLTKSSWQSVRLPSANDRALPGAYSLIIVEEGTNNGIPWQIKNISIQSRSVHWQARSFVDGPWGLNDRDWIRNDFVHLTFNNKISNNSNKNDGVIFAKQDTELQIRAHAVTPYVEIYNFDVQPKYATLGNIVEDG